ncbi:snu71p [Saccharomyces arboricola H-6]|uniref:U1 small nuclear ribonucleoprotein component SNU71 n=1 Tax=Saccharomyces arboricola (strain H-6 / AS 2.3317 / CBS 10644) TaxID=1160507 RepID=J8Q243_SACAR|nr:snu71p [Saccharomyces arboricola H-6]
MKDFVFVSPQLYLTSQEDWKSNCAKTGYIPILKNDLQRFQDSLKHIIDVRNSISRAVLNNNDDEAMKNSDRNATSSNAKDTTIGNSNATSGSNAGASHYQELKQFLPISLDQQIHTVSLQGVSASFSHEQIETLLENCLNLALMETQCKSSLRIEAWSSFSSFLDTQDIFLRFNKVDDNEEFVKTVTYWKGLLALIRNIHEDFKIELHLDSNTQEYIEDRARSTIEIKPENAESFYSIFKHIEGQTDESNMKNEQLDDSSIQYKVDTNTLSDLPPDALDQLCKDIVEFRTKVVSIEKEKKMKSTYEESRRQRHQMQKVFDQIKKNHSGAKYNTNADGGDANMEEEEEEEEEEEDEDDEDDTQGDLALEKRREGKELEESNRRYEDLLYRLRTEIEPRIKSIRADIISVGYYEEHLEKNRSLYLKELLHLANDVHYDHHRSFKEQEEERDEEDRAKNGNAKELVSKHASNGMPTSTEKADAQTLPEGAIGSRNHDAYKNVSESPEHVKIKFEFKKAIDHSVESSSEDEEVRESEQPPTMPTEETAAEDGLPFTADELDTRLARLKESRYVDELVREFLGVYEDDLVDYILENIRVNRSKQTLLNELMETFDDDGETIADRLWSCEEFRRGT